MITLKTYAGQNINPADDAILYDRIIGASGKVEGCEITHLGANQLRIAAGRMIIKGRTVTVTEETIYAIMPTSGTVNGRLLVHMDLSNTEEPISFVTQAVSTLPKLIQNEDCNLENGVYEIALATYKVNENAITNLSVVMPNLPYSERKIQEELNAINTDLDKKQEELNAINTDLAKKQEELNAINTDLAKKQDKLTNPLVQADVINNLNSTATNKPLSANQGKILYDSLNKKQDALIYSTYVNTETTNSTGAITLGIDISGFKLSQKPKCAFLEGQYTSFQNYIYSYDNSTATLAVFAVNYGIPNTTVTNRYGVLIMP